LTTAPLWEFRPLAESDLPLLFSWLKQLHVLEWWGGERSLDEVRAKYLPDVNARTVRPYIAA